MGLCMELGTSAFAALDIRILMFRSQVVVNHTLVFASDIDLLSIFSFLTMINILIPLFLRSDISYHEFLIRMILYSSICGILSALL